MESFIKLIAKHPLNDVKTVQWGLTYESLNQGDADITMVFTTDSQLLKYDLKVLEDDKHFFPFYKIRGRKPLSF
jgi:osmoprotectant transport system substrate-binding protein